MKRSKGPPVALSLEKQHQVALASAGRVDLIDAFVAANPARLPQNHLEIVSGWRHLVAGRFIVLRQLKKHAILLPCDSTHKAFGVIGLTDPMEWVIRKALPAMIETVLLPFRGRIIYNGMINGFNVAFGPGSLGGFEQAYRDAKASKQLVTSLPAAPVPEPPSAASSRPKPVNPPTKKAARESVPDFREILAQVTRMTDAFCQARLNEEYAELCRKLAGKLAAKRPSPLLKGRLETWACGIVRTIGMVNFLDDRTQSPHLKLPEIDRAFGISESTGQGKSRTIRTMLKIRQFDHCWTLPSRVKNDPMIWTLTRSDGLLVDIRKEPVPLQRSAFKQGLIPYVPVDRAAAEVRKRIEAAPSRRLFQFKISHHYDFGDGWMHDVLFEGSPPPQSGVHYPQCLEGERACPPEDVGGIPGYEEYVDAICDPNHKRHREMLDWHSPCNPDAFSPRHASHRMQEGMPDWRTAE